MSVVAVANQKGGVGKTTTTVNLAAAAAEMGLRTLVIDADAQANATSALGADASGAHIYDALLGEIPLNQCIVPTAWAPLDVAPSSMDLVAAELELAGRPQREFVLRGALSAVAGTYDLVLIDCGPSLGLMTLNALVASDAAIAPVQCEYLALEGLSALLETIRRVQMHLHPGLQLLGVVATAAQAGEDLITCAKSLDKHYIPTRYPNGFDTGAPVDFYTKKDSDDAILCADRLIGFARGQIEQPKQR